jgi:hypothetical protein
VLATIDGGGKFEEKFKLLRAACRCERHPVVINLRYFPPYTNDPNWMPNGAEPIGDITQLKKGDKLVGESIEWLGPSLTV